jgi:hypothetical protein
MARDQLARSLFFANPNSYTNPNPNPVPCHKPRQDMTKEALVSAMKARTQSSFASLAMVSTLTLTLNLTLHLTLTLTRTITVGQRQLVLSKHCGEVPKKGEGLTHTLTLSLSLTLTLTL